MRSIELPPVLAHKVAKFAAKKSMTRESALAFLIDKVCPTIFLPSRGVHTHKKADRKGRNGGAK